MKAASSGGKRFRSLAPVLGAVVLGTAGLAMVLFLLSGSAVNAAPPIPVRYTPTDGHHTRNPGVEFAWEDVGAPTYTLQLGGDVYTLTTTSYVTTLPEGTHPWAVQAIDELGDGSGYGTPWSVTVDTTPPPQPAQLTPPNGTQTASTEIDFTWSNVGVPTYTLRMDGGVYTTTDTSMLLTLGEGGHTWAAQAVDAAGNVSGYPDDWTVSVDTTPPPVPPLASPENSAVVGSQNVTFEWNDVGAASYDLRVMGIVPPRDPFSVTVTGTSRPLILLDGTYNWSVRSRDAVGNVSAYANPWSLTVDTVPPGAPTLIAPPDGSDTRQPEVTFEWSYQAGVTYDLSIDGVLYEDLPVNSWQLALPDDAYAWKVRAVDGVGNESAYSEEWLVTVDTISPVVTIIAPSPGTVLTTTHLPSVTIYGTASDAGTGLDRVEVNVGAGWRPTEGTPGNWSFVWELAAIDEQFRNVRARAWDQAGNSTETLVLVTIDTLGPTTYDLVHDQGTYVNGPVVYSWSVMPDAAGIRDYQIWIENSLSFSVVLPTTEPTFTFGAAVEESQEYYAWARARDERDNWGPWSARSPVVIPDLTPPEILYPEILEASEYLHADGLTLYYTSVMSVSQLVEVTGISIDTVSRPVRVEFSEAFGDDPLDETVEFAPWSSARPPLYGYHVDPGESASGQIVATVRDAAGNTAAQTFSYEPDGTPPESDVDAPEYATGAPIYVTWTATDTQCGVGTVQLYYSSTMSGGWLPASEPGGSGSGESGTFWFVPPYGNGLYQFASRAEDVLGNRETGPFVAQTWTVYDTTKPSSEVTWTPEFATGDTITGTWEAVSSEAPITTVDLWVRPVNGVDPDAWTLARTVGTGGAVSGTFTYDVIYDGIYYFATVAHDAADKHEPEPHGDGDAQTIRDSQILAPIGVALVQSQEWSTDNDFEVVWTNPEDLSGIVAATYQLYPESGPPLDPVREYINDPEIEGIHLPAEGRYTLWIWLEDEAGNVGTPAPAVPQTVLKYDRTIGTPMSLTVSPDSWSATNSFDLSWTNPEEVSGIAGAWYKVGSPPFWAEDGVWWQGSDLQQIEGITASNQGEVTLYLWLQDVAGNVDHRRWQSVTLRYDASPPWDVSLIAPSLSPLVWFNVEWQASDYHSGVISYTIAVSGWPTHEWEPWLISTTETLALYHAPRANDVYDFQVTAYDRAGNWAQDEGRARIDMQYVHLPLSLVRSQWLPWHDRDPYEENNSEVDAYGPLESLDVYGSAIWDETDPTDFYYFEPSTPGLATATLDGMASGIDLDLAVWVYSELSQSYQLVDWGGEYGNTPEVVSFPVQAGRRYWIEIRPYAIRESTHPNWQPNAYTVQVIYN